MTTIMAIDDSPDIQCLLEVMLEEAVPEATRYVVGSREEAIRCLDRVGNIDLYISDTQLGGGIWGDIVYRSLEETFPEKFKDTSVIGMSGNPDAIKRWECVNGLYQLVPKPFMLDAFSRLIRTYLFA